MSQYTIDHVKRMKHIKATLDNNATNQEAVQHKEDMLDELLDIVDNIDYARGQLFANMTRLTQDACLPDLALPPCDITHIHSHSLLPLSPSVEVGFCMNRFGFMACKFTYCVLGCFAFC